MSQATANIANTSRSLYRAAENAALQAIQSVNSGASAPAETYPYMFWADTSAGLLKQRNAANSAWTTIGTLGATNLGLLSLAGGTMTGALNEKGFTVAAHATTCDIWSGGNYGTLTGSAVTFTDVADAPVADAWRWIRSNAAHILTSNANITVQGGTRTIAAGDLLLWHAITTSTFEVYVLPISGTVVDASDTVKGIVELATGAETITGTDATRAVTPAAFNNASLGYNQTTQDVSGSRAVATTYTNSTGKPKMVSIGVTLTSTNVVFRINGATIGIAGSSILAQLGGMVMPGETYGLFITSGSGLTITSWKEQF